METYRTILVTILIVYIILAIIYRIYDRKKKIKTGDFCEAINWYAENTMDEYNSLRDKDFLKNYKANYLTFSSAIRLDNMRNRTPNSTNKKCPYCGNNLYNDDRYCPSCGAN